jgi:hypothetical protein
MLNVAVTRACYRAEIVASIRASDIPESVTGEGVQHLRRYLEYAADTVCNGRLGILAVTT